MTKKTETPAGCDPARGNSCNWLKVCRKCNKTSDSMQVLADIMLASSVRALRTYLQDFGDLLVYKGQSGDYLAALVMAFCTTLLAEAEKHEAITGGEK